MKVSKVFIFLEKHSFKDIYSLLKSSLLSRILLFFSFFALLIWLVTALFTWIQGREYIDSFFDTQQILFAKNFAVMDFQPTISELPKTKQMSIHKNRRGEEDDDALAIAIFSMQGELLFSDGDEGKNIPFYYHSRDMQGFDNVKIDDEIWRIFWLESLDGTRIIAVAQEEDYREDMAIELLMGQLIPWIASLPLLLSWLLWLLYKETRSLRSLTRNLNTRKADDLTPLSFDGIALEIRPLIHSINSLFERTGALLAKERTFVANAAHELRTPLTGLAVQAEVIGLCGDDEESRNHALQLLLQGIKRSTRLIDQLLLLSSLENKQILNTKDENNLLGQATSWEEILNTAIHEAQELAEAKNIHIALHSTDSAKIANYPDLWAIALRNLLDNALIYGKVDTEIRVNLTKDALIIENNADHISKDILEKLGQRFYRPAGQNKRGTGLGLAIVGHICQLQDCTFIIDNANKGEAKSYLAKDINLSLDGVITCILFNK